MGSSCTCASILTSHLTQKSTRSQLHPRDTNSLISLGSASTYSVFASTGISTVQGTSNEIVHGDIGKFHSRAASITVFLKRQ